MSVAVSGSAGRRNGSLKRGVQEPAQIRAEHEVEAQSHLVPLSTLQQQQAQLLLEFSSIMMYL